MIEYGITEMDYISAKDPVMKELVAHFGHMGGGERNDVFASLVSSIVGQMLSNKVADVIDGRLRQMVGDYTPELILQKSVEAVSYTHLDVYKRQDQRLIHLCGTG